MYRITDRFQSFFNSNKLEITEDVMKYLCGVRYPQNYLEGKFLVGHRGGNYLGYVDFGNGKISEFKIGDILALVDDKGSMILEQSDVVRTKEFMEELRQYINYIYGEISYVGGHLHIVLDDGNTDDSSIQWCLDKIKTEENYIDKHVYTRCCELLLQIPENIRSQYTKELYCEGE